MGARMYILERNENGGWDGYYSHWGASVIHRFSEKAVGREYDDIKHIQNFKELLNFLKEEKNYENAKLTDIIHIDDIIIEAYAIDTKVNGIWVILVFVNDIHGAVAGKIKTIRDLWDLHNAYKVLSNFLRVANEGGLSKELIIETAKKFRSRSKQTYPGAYNYWLFFDEIPKSLLDILEGKALLLFG